MDALVKRFEAGEWLSEAELAALAEELGEWVKQVYAEDEAAEEEHQQLAALAR